MATTTNLNMQGIATDLFNRMQELFNPAKDLSENLLTAGLPADKGGSESVLTAPAGVSYERYEIDYLNVKLIEQGIAGENRKASSSRLSIEAVHLTYERLQTGSGAGEEQNGALAKSFTLAMTRVEYQSLNAFSGRQPAPDALPDFLKKFSADPAPAGLTGEEDGLQEGQQKDLRSLELLLRTFTDKSDKEIRETIRDIAGAMRQMNGKDRAADGGQATAGTGSAVEMVQVEVKLYASGKFELREVQDPLVIDLDGDGIELTDAASGVDFDLTGDGVKERTGTVSSDDAFLAYDRNGNGGIDSGKELFGDQHGAANGFAELQKFDGNGDAKISAADAVYGDLRLWTDRNANGVSEADELRGLADAGISAINLNYRTYDIAGEKNALPEAAAVEFADGRRHAAGDVNISYIV